MKVCKVVYTRAVTALSLVISTQWFKRKTDEAGVPLGSAKLTNVLRAEPCRTGGRGTPQGRRQTHWRWTGPAKQIEVDARIAKNGVQVVIHLPNLVVAPEFHGDCSLRNHHFLQATTTHVGVNTFERTGTTSTSRVPLVRISTHPLKKKRTASNVPLGSVNSTILFNTVESPGPEDSGAMGAVRLTGGRLGVPGTLKSMLTFQNAVQI